MLATGERIDHVNALLMAHSEVESFACRRSGYLYDAKLRLRGERRIVVKFSQMSAVRAGFPLYQAWLMLSDVRAEQHDLANYEIIDTAEDKPLWLCRAVTVMADGERLELR